MTMTLVLNFLSMTIVVMSPTIASEDAGSILMSLVTADVKLTTVGHASVTQSQLD